MCERVLGKRDMRNILLLFLFISLIQLVPLGKFWFFGSQGDWLSQHVAMGETIRQRMLETGSLIPQYLYLGAGSSGYDAAYYGILRPDILLSCLFPQVEMKYFIAGYSLLGIYVSGALCYFWLRKHQISSKCSLLAGIFFLSSGSFYQAHHQIMFINYMPFLLLAFLGVDRVMKKGKMDLLAVSIFAMILHSFYYVPASLVALGLYGIHEIMQKKDHNLKKVLVQLFLGVALGLGMGMILLLPTGINILSTSKDGGSFQQNTWKAFDWSMKGLFYSPYSCGVTLSSLYFLLLALKQKRTRFLAGSLLIVFLFPSISWILNGFLYARGKILIPFLPLIIFLVGKMLEVLWTGKLSHDWKILFLCGIPAIFSTMRSILLVDFIFLAFWLGITFRNRGKIVGKGFFPLCVLFPACVGMVMESSDSVSELCRRYIPVYTGTGYVSQEDSRQDIFRILKEKNGSFSPLYRTEILTTGMTNCNLATKNIKRTSMYSSIYNDGYGKFFYDTMKNAISYNNRVALVCGTNPIFQNFMGIRYLVTEPEKIPYGYEKIWENENYVLSENPQVLPICYGTSQLCSQKTYEKQMDFEKMELLCRYGIVKDTEEKPIHLYGKKEDPEKFFNKQDLQQFLQMSRKGKQILGLSKSCKDKILLLQFQVENTGGKEAVIEINGIKNKLSSKKAPYPNGNHRFSYVIDSGKNLEKLQIEVSKGTFQMKDLQLHTIDKDKIYSDHVYLPKEWKGEEQKNKIFSGILSMKEDGYLMTSFPFREGYKILVDGEERKIEKVNETFIGCPLEKGAYRIQIFYETPGYSLGKWISLLSGITYFMILYIQNRKKEK